MFSPPAFITIGDEYDKRTTNSSKKRSNTSEKPFTVPAHRHPHLLDSTFTPFSSLSTGVPYQGTLQVASTIASNARKENNSSMRCCADLPPFKPPGPSHKSSGKGDYYGTFCEKAVPKHETELPYVSKKVEVKVSELVKPRNFYTNPAKKGTYGFAGLTIGKSGEVQYIADPYEPFHNSDNNAATTIGINSKSNTNYSSSNRVGPAFRAAVQCGRFFDESEHGFPTVYSLSKPLLPKKTVNTTSPFRNSYELCKP
uniref:Cilia-and flagella-associated protein 96 n=1 Tax=Lygus hesperus TaxID=30085 RepID=A0A0A9W141_LYGHE